MRVLVITGAGVSAESGIPTFRGKGGYWRNFDAAKLATPEAFERDPKLVWEWYSERRRVENYLDRGACDLVIVAGTTAAFGYIIDWALRASGCGGELLEVNPEETPISQFATQLVREPAAIALPRIVNAIVSYSHG